MSDTPLTYLEAAILMEQLGPGEVEVDRAPAAENLGLMERCWMGLAHPRDESLAWYFQHPQLVWHVFGVRRREA